jgi:hypothetical protein
MNLILVFIIVSSVSATSIPWSKCDPGSGHNCLTWNNTTLSCDVKNCWKYDDIAGCERDGKPFLPALILQSIPITGVFGSGFGNIGRWDIFTTYIWGFFGPPILFCVLSTILWCCCVPTDVGAKQPLLGGSGESAVGCTILTGACSCVWIVIVMSLWIWGIITIAGKEVDAPWLSADGVKIMCPMV